ncbi:glycosyltransferase family 1 protein [Stereum hirsutum FP-91666 SS1]|uniref:glycosyltransferase family 1 protein n=1 Tax=Stereum hirsutum (strain FP-91666) TaxID=721885 RepID=UPI000440D6C7|nr:glycosyltransferase family 1 protein [Stereum hirsutum FP-91666 SS1]EIM89907.1 glycosyltransferase family 1 protein [Stereum hirsutum FP-91666 SS1]
MRVFVTVGSTKFDSLIQSVLSDDVLHAFNAKGYTDIVVQCGNSQLDPSSGLVTNETAWTLERDGIRLDMWRFKPSLEEEYNGADLVVSHAGSGTILDVLRKSKALIVVPNPTLLDNHQEELAKALADLGHLKASNIRELARTIRELDISTIKPFPAFDGSRFRRLLDEEMGFV